MAFEIVCSDREHAQKVAATVNLYIEKSRFYLSGSGFGRGESLSIEKKGRRTIVALRGVRLREAKGYCGNHAGPCKIGGGKHKRLRFLEGCDWVSFNDMLNDALDSIGHDGNVESSFVRIRKGKMRRTEYFSTSGNGDFDWDTDHSSYTENVGGQSIQSECEEGTPGIVGYGVECVEA